MDKPLELAHTPHPTHSTNVIVTEHLIERFTLINLGKALSANHLTIRLLSAAWP